MAEKLAGIKLVIARSFERLYRQNADNIGLFTSTEFSLAARIRQGQPIYIEELLAGHDRLAAAIFCARPVCHAWSDAVGGVRVWHASARCYRKSDGSGTRWQG